MKISARNQIRGKIIAIDHGATTSHVKIDIGASVATAAIAKTSVEDMGPAVGKTALAIIKASDVMAGID